MKLALAQINPIVGALEENRKKIEAFIAKAKEQKAELIVFPELALVGYPPEDLLLMPSFIKALSKELEALIPASKGIVVVVGTVRENPSKGEKRLYNTAAILQDGELVGFQDKALLPDYDVFSERRYFEPSTETRVWSLLGRRVGITICEDLWQHAEAVEDTSYPRDPVKELKERQPELVINISASPFYVRRHETRLGVCEAASKTLRCPVVLCNQVGGNDSLIFDGTSAYFDEAGHLLAVAKRFKEDFLLVDTEEKREPILFKTDPIPDLFEALVLGVRDYFHKQGFKQACFGLSGGIDSALVACIAREALGAENLLAIGMPSRYSSPSSLSDAQELVKRLGINFKQISIETPFQTFLDLLEPQFEGLPQDVTEENVQARIRGMILMAFSNKFGYLVLGPGNKSEMAMGYVTLYGDMCGGLGVLSDVTKEQVYALSHFVNRKQEVIPKNILDKVPSAELRPDQKDSDTLPEYAIVDAILASYVEEHLSPQEIAKKHALDEGLVEELVRKIHLNEYKRRQAPPGLRVTKKAFSVGRRFPIVQKWNL